MPQSFAIGRGIEDSKALAATADNTDLLLQLVNLMARQNQILVAINLNLGGACTTFIDPDDIDLDLGG